MSQENVEAVRRSLAAWDRGDFDAFVQDWHPESEFFSAFMVQGEGDARPFRGSQGMRQYWDAVVAGTRMRRIYKAPPHR